MYKTAFLSLCHLSQTQILRELRLGRRRIEVLVLFIGCHRKIAVQFDKLSVQGPDKLHAS